MILASVWSLGFHSVSVGTCRKQNINGAKLKPKYYTSMDTLYEFLEHLEDSLKLWKIWQAPAIIHGFL